MLRLGNFKSETCMNTSKTEKHFRNYFAMGGGKKTTQGNTK